MAAAKEMRRALMKRVLNKLVQRPAILPLSQRNNIERSPGLFSVVWLQPPPTAPSLSLSSSFCVEGRACLCKLTVEEGGGANNASIKSVDLFLYIFPF